MQHATLLCVHLHGHNALSDQKELLNSVCNLDTYSRYIGKGVVKFILTRWVYMQYSLRYFSLHLTTPVPIYPLEVSKFQSELHNDLESPNPPYVLN